MKKSVKTTLLIAALLFIFSLVVILIKNQPKQILFYSNTCPHCQVVEEYIKDNNVKDYLVFQELEVSTNPLNGQLLAKKAEICGLPTDNLGVPFFFDGASCYVGDEDIIKHFSDKK